MSISPRLLILLGLVACTTKEPLSSPRPIESTGHSGGITTSPGGEVVKLVASEMRFKYDWARDPKESILRVDADGAIRSNGIRIGAITTDGYLFEIVNGQETMIGRLDARGEFVFVGRRDVLLIDAGGSIHFKDYKPTESWVKFHDDGRLEGIVGTGDPGDGGRYIGPPDGRVAASLALVLVTLTVSLGGGRLF